MGSFVLAATSSKSSGFNPTDLFLILVVVVGLYMLMMRPRRRMQQAQQRQNAVQPGARVRTTAGMYATVVAVDGDDVVLEVAPDVEVRYMKRAIMDVVSPAEETAEETDADGYDADGESAGAEDTESAADDVDDVDDVDDDFDDIDDFDDDVEADTQDSAQATAESGTGTAKD